MAANRRKEILSNLKVISDCENARLALNYHQREKLQSELDPLAKEKADRLLEHLCLDEMEELLTESAVMARVVAKNTNATSGDTEMKDNTQ